MEIKTGQFSISPGKTVAGELQIAGRESSLVLRDNEVIQFDDRSGLWITGSLYDLTKVTLIQCIQVAQQTRTWPQEGDRAHSATLFPHFVAQGRVHLPRDELSIRGIHFTFEDAASLFYDFDAFGSVLDAAPFIDAVVNANAKKYARPIRIGPNPEIAYFAGQRLIVEVDTVLGKIRAEHSPTFPIGGPRGVRIDNEILVSIIPGSPIAFDDAVDRIFPLLRFVTVAVGRAQVIPVFTIDVGAGETFQRLQVHWSHHPKRSPEGAVPSSSPQPGDLPLDPIHHLTEFVAVLEAWLAADKERRAARVRADDSFTRQSFYPIDRLVGAANAFDLLPASAVPDRVELTAEVLAAKKQCRAIFRALPDSDERESLLRAIGRLGDSTLKQKIRHRANIITRVSGNEYFQSLNYVCDHAVDCRNHYVHGSPVKFNLELPSPHFGFLTDTLEFIFAASELIEAGWDIRPFLKRGTSMTHPFGIYAVNYNTNLRALRASVKPSTTDPEDP